MSLSAAQLVHLSRLKKGQVFFLISNRPLDQVDPRKVVKSINSVFFFKKNDLSKAALQKLPGHFPISPFEICCYWPNNIGYELLILKTI